MAKLRVVTDFKISKSAIFGKEYRVSFLCPHCNTTLKVDEEDLGTPDICPSCHESYQLSSAVQDAIERERQRVEDTAREKQRLKEEAEANEYRCFTCGKKDSILDRLTSYDGGYYCQSHYDAHKRAVLAAKERQLDKRVMVTTTPNFEGFRIIEYLGIDGIEFVVGTGIFSEVVTEVGDLFGGRSQLFESKLRDGRKKALQMLQSLALQQNANAVVAIDFDHSQFSSNRTAIIITGTFVKVVPAVSGVPECEAVQLESRIKVHCECGKTGLVNRKHIGKTMTCPKCGIGRIKIVDPETSLPDDEEIGTIDIVDEPPANKKTDLPHKQLPTNSVQVEKPPLKAATADIAKRYLAEALEAEKYDDKGRLERHKPRLGIGVILVSQILLDYAINSVTAKTPPKFDPKIPIGQQTKPVSQMFEAMVSVTLCDRPNHPGTFAELIASRPKTYEEVWKFNCKEFTDGEWFFLCLSNI